MIQIGKKNRLLIKGNHSHGVLLNGGELGDILLKEKSVAQKYQPGDEVEVFVYVDREGCLLATIQKPYAMVGEFAKLTVVATSDAGAFLGWGLASDLFVPKSEQQDNMRQGKAYVVYVLLSNKNNSIIASSKLDKYLNQAPPKFSEGQEVELLVTAKTDLGYNAVINSSHLGMIYENEVFQKIFIGQRLQGYIKKIREDQKIDLRLQQTGYQRVDEISQTIFNTIKECGGTVGVTDKSPAEDIYDLFGVSKKVFKKAIGALYKKKYITLGADGIKLNDDDSGG